NRRTMAVYPAGGSRLSLGGREFLSFASNDYLDFLSRDYLDLFSQVERCSGRGDMVPLLATGSGSSRLVSGNTVEHSQLEDTLARFKQVESATLYGSGYLANLGLFPVLCSRDDVVIADRLIHASMIDGIMLSRARLMRFQHNDMAQAEAMLKKAAGQRRQGSALILATESVFSMDGDCAPLAELVELAGRYDAWLVVDEAHAFGVFGDAGRGCLSRYRGCEEIAAAVGTLSKALGSYGGFVTGPALLKELLVNRSRTLIYTTALPPVVAASARAAVMILEREPDLGVRLLKKAELFRRALSAAGIETIPGESQIVAVVVGGNENTVNAAAALRELGYIVPAIRSPTVPEGTERLRFSLTLGHKDEEILQLAEDLRSVLSNRKTL
ncbi:MAG: 8-amino-7-oxononanoate synthase, partial [bacterium]|nr:8-amino-7-oxononanoate synthase [bacterium]